MITPLSARRWRKETTLGDLTDIPAQAFQVFLKRLEAAGVSADVVERLRKAESDGQPLSEAALREALFNDDGQTS